MRSVPLTFLAAVSLGFAVFRRGLVGKWRSFVESESRYRSLVDNMPGVVFDVTERRRTADLSASDSRREWRARSAEDHAGESLLDQLEGRTRFVLRLPVQQGDRTPEGTAGITDLTDPLRL